MSNFRGSYHSGILIRRIRLTLAFPQSTRPLHSAGAKRRPLDSEGRIGLEEMNAVMTGHRAKVALRSQAFIRIAADKEDFGSHRRQPARDSCREGEGGGEGHPSCEQVGLFIGPVSVFFIRLCWDAVAASFEPLSYAVDGFGRADNAEVDLLWRKRGLEVEWAIVHDAKADVHVPSGAKLKMGFFQKTYVHRNRLSCRSSKLGP
jgi:hypothetical protein